MIKLIFDIQTQEVETINVSDPVPNLIDVQNNKLAELNTAYSDVLTTGFTTNATGTPIQIKYSELDQLNFTKRTNAVALGTSNDPFQFGTANGVITFSIAQWKIVAKDAENHEMNCYTQLVTKRNDVNNATTVDAVNAIVWE